MKLYFTCPVLEKVFGSEDYSLVEGHLIVEDGEKRLKGDVLLNSPCPLCGQKHRFEVKDVICPLSRGENEG